MPVASVHLYTWPCAIDAIVQMTKAIVILVAQRGSCLGMEFTLSGVSGNLATLEAAASTIHVGGYDLSGATLLYSLGNNSGGVPFDTIVAPH